MTHLVSETSDQPTTLLKIDSAGRVQRTREEQEAILNSFEQSAMSGAQFAKMHGLNYQTFSYWRARRRKEQSKISQSVNTEVADFSFIEVESSELTPSKTDNIEILIGDKVTILIGSIAQIPLVTALIKELA